jgi:hypothetical protein
MESKESSWHWLQSILRIQSLVLPWFHFGWPIVGVSRFRLYLNRFRFGQDEHFLDHERGQMILLYRINDSQPYRTLTDGSLSAHDLNPLHLSRSCLGGHLSVMMKHSNSMNMLSASTFGNAPPLFVWSLSFRRQWESQEEEERRLKVTYL